MKDIMSVDSPATRSPAPLRSAGWTLLLLALATPAWAAAPQLPTWFPAQNTYRVGGDTVYETFGDGGISNVQGDTVHYRGKHWEARFFPLDGQTWNWKISCDAIVAGLTQQGYVVDYHHTGDSSGDVSFHKGSGDGSWHVEISVDQYNYGSVTIVQQAPLSVALTLQPPAAKPVKVGDKDDFPYLKPLPGLKLFATQRDDSPMDYQPAKGDSIKPFGGSIMKRYNYPASLSQLEFEQVYESALVKAGWTLGEKNPEQGFVYAHYDKNGRNIYLYASRGGDDVSFVVAEPPQQLNITLKPPAGKPVQFGDRDAFPYLTPLPGWKLAYTKHDGDPLLVYRTGDDKGELVGSGTILKVYQEDKPVSNNQFEQTYERALTRAGWTIGEKNMEQGFLYAHYDKNGRDIWAYLSGGEHHSFEVSDLGTGLKAALVKQCKVAVYGVNFDFNKATLRPDAEPVLRQVLTLFKDEPKLAVEIGGHTDNVGTPTYNQKLSEQRAAAVKAWLVAHGVAETRLTTHGYGQTQPLVPNDTDAHRAKNRRVELKKPGCKE